MAEVTSEAWPKEHVPDEDYLYYRIHVTDLDENGGLRPNSFRDRGGAMSTDWSKYSTPEESRARARIPEKNGIVVLGVGEVRGIPGLWVEHTPDPILNNRAHTDVGGPKEPEVRVKLARIAQWKIRPNVEK